MSRFKSGLSRILSPVLLFATLFAVPAPAHAVTPGDSTCDLSGSGSQVDPYLVGDRTDLEEIIDCADDTTLSYYKQEAVIDLSASVWTPLVDQDPSGSTGLKISYDGDHWAIVGMKAEGYWMASLFGHLAGGSDVKNLAFLGNSVGYVKTAPSSGEFIPSKHLAGVVAALSTGGVTISNVQIEGFTRISGATVGALVGKVQGGTTSISNAWVQIIGFDPSWANSRGWISAMNSKHYESSPPTISTVDISAAGGLLGTVTGSGVDVTISSSFVNTSVGVGGTDAEPSRFRYAPANIGGVVGLFEQGALTIESSSFSGNLLGTLRDEGAQNANLIGVAPIVGYVYSTSSKGGLSMNVSKFRIATELSGDGYVSGLFGSYRTDLGPTDINISGVLATGSINPVNSNKGRVSGGFIQQLGASNADVEISDSVLLYKFGGPFGTNPTRVVESGKPATVVRTYYDSQDIPEIYGSLSFNSDQATALPAGWSSGTAPAPFSSGDADGVELSSVALMGNWTNETFAACSGLASNDPVSGVMPGSGLRLYFDNSLTPPAWQVTSAYGLVIPSIETGTCIENGLTFAYPNSGSGPTISTSRSVRANVSSGVFEPTTTGKHAWYRIKSGTTALPAGLYLNPGTGAIIGTPSADLTSDLTLTIQGLTRQQAIYETTVTFSAGSGSAQPLNATPAPPYSGPTISTPPAETSGGKAVLRGKNLDQVTGAEVDGVSCDISYVDEELTVEIPDSVSNGVKDLVLTGSFGRLTLQGGLILDRVVRAESSSHFWTQKQVDGSVKVYAKNVTGAGKVQFFVDGEEIAWVNDLDGTDPKLRFAGGSAYLVRTVSLDPGKNRFEIKLDGVRVWRSTYAG